MQYDDRDDMLLLYVSPLTPPARGGSIHVHVVSVYVMSVKLDVYASLVSVYASKNIPFVPVCEGNTPSSSSTSCQ